MNEMRELLRKIEEVRQKLNHAVENGNILDSYDISLEMDHLLEEYIEKSGQLLASQN